jgi:hypothetical protein
MSGGSPGADHCPPQKTFGYAVHWDAATVPTGQTQLPAATAFDTAPDTSAKVQAGL